MNSTQLTRAYHIDFSRKALSRDVQFSSRDSALLDSFALGLEKQYGGSAGASLLFDYFIFQFEYWLELKDTWIDRGMIPLSWIIGTKALQRWIDRPFRDLTKARGVMSEYDLHPIRDEMKPSKDVSEIKSWEELEKRRHYGTDDGLRNCFEATTLYNQKSDLCSQCTNKTACTALLKTEYPLIYAKRGLQEERTGRRRRGNMINL